MKTKHTLSLMIALSLSAIPLTAAPGDGALTVHEWGTFTSLQGGDGALIPWRPLQSSQLPKFVYDWKTPGSDRQPTGMFLFGGKGMITSLQRMETPVVYFYSDHAQTVDVTVKFPKGQISEWFPQATQVGPSVAVPNAVDAAGVIPSHTAESLIRWAGLKVLPTSDRAEIEKCFLTDNSGLNYFAARETDANDLQAGEISKASLGEPFEKFLFYRGIGNFTTPLRVTMTTDSAVTLANTGKDVLPDLLVVSIKNKVGRFFPVTQLRAGEERIVSTAPALETFSGAGFNLQIKQSITRALVKTGLYQREAEAMVKTWSDSWFTEEGVRVLYILPRTWTDDTLPMTMNPAPGELVRVMVGRAEVFTPALEKSLAEWTDKAGNGDAAAAKQTSEVLKSLGRFGPAALQRAIASAKLQPAEQMKVFALLEAADRAN